MSSKLRFDAMLRARVTAEQKQQLEAIALANQWHMGVVVREAVRDYLAEHWPLVNQDRPEPDPAPPPPPSNSDPELASV